MTSSPLSSFLDCTEKLPENRTDDDFRIIFDNLKKFETLASFRDCTLHSMSQTIRIEKYHKNSLIFRTGERITNWFILIKGLIKIGEEILHPINKFGRKSHFTKVRSVDCIAVFDSEILIIGYQDIEDPTSSNNLKEDTENIELMQTDNNENIAKNLNYNSPINETTDIIVLSNDSFNFEIEETEKENLKLKNEVEIICLSDEEDKTNSNSPQSELKLNKECFELYSIDKKISGGSNSNSEYQEVMVRWRVKKRADPYLNLSMSNYKLRVFGDQRSALARKFKPNIFFDEIFIETNLSPEEKLKLDQEALVQKLEFYSFKFNKIIEDYDTFYQQCVNYLDQNYEINTKKIENNFNNAKDKLMENNDNWYKNELVRLDKDRNKFVHNVQDLKKQAETAFQDLFDSGCYVKGKLSEYFILETKQPLAKRSGYVDIGKRLLLLTKNQIKNILIENLIYEHYYGKP